MHREMDVHAGPADERAFCVRWTLGADSTALLASPRNPSVLRLLQRDEEIIHRIPQGKDAQIRLKLEPQFTGWRVQDFVGVIGGFERPSKATTWAHSKRTMSSASASRGALHCGSSLRNCSKPRAEVAQTQRNRTDSASRYAVANFRNFRSSKHCTQAGIVVVEAVEQAKPILTIVNFQPLKGTQPIVRLDEFGGLGTQVSRPSSSALCMRQRAVERAEDRARHRPLQIEQVSPRAQPYATPAARCFS